MNEVIEKRTQRKFYASDSEYGIIEQKSKFNGYTSTSEYVRDCALKNKMTQAKRLSPPLVDPDLLRQLSFVGNNLNQLTKLSHLHANNDVLNLAVVAFELSQMQKSINEIKQHYSISQRKKATLSC